MFEVGYYKKVYTLCFFRPYMFHIVKKQYFGVCVCVCVCVCLYVYRDRKKERGEQTGRER